MFPKGEILEFSRIRINKKYFLKRDPLRNLDVTTFFIYVPKMINSDFLFKGKIANKKCFTYKFA